MTESEKARAYDEALERAKSFELPEYKNIMASIFPELKESEDEKIRKALIELVKQSSEILSKSNQDGMLAWLEKQGQTFTKKDIDDAYLKGICNAKHELEKQGSSPVKWQKNTPHNKPAIKHSVLMKTTQGIAEGEWQGEDWFQYRWSWTLKESYVLAWMELSDLDEQGEQKPAVVDFNAKDWYVSKVDGKIHDMTYNPADKVEPKFKVKYAGSEYNVLEVKDIAGVTFYGIEDEPNHIDYVKADNCEIISGYGIKENGSPYPTKPSMFSEQKPAWSEEDEENLNKVIGVIERRGMISTVEQYKDILHTYICWLKSLKTRIGG